MTARTTPASASPAADSSASEPSASAAQPSGALDAIQAALAAEHAAVYGYGVVGGRLDGERREKARTAYDAHRARRDTLERTVRDLGGRPEAAAPAYALPFSVEDGAAAERLAARLEDRVAAVYADAVRELRGELRADAARALREAAVRAVGWRGSSVAFPGMAERARDRSASASASASTTDSGRDPDPDSEQGAVTRPGAP